MTSDLDLGVEAAEEAAGRACLEELGYVQVAGARGLARPRDAGMLELRPSRANGLEVPKLVQQEGLRVKIPSAQSRALHWIVHDLLKEGTTGVGGSISDTFMIWRDWPKATAWIGRMRASMLDRSARNALDTQLLALHHFFGSNIPAECAKHPMVRFQHWRRVFTAKHPFAGAPLRLAGNLAWGTRRLLRSDGWTVVTRPTWRAASPARSWISMSDPKI